MGSLFLGHTNAEDVTEGTEEKIPVSDGTASARVRFGAGPWPLSDGAVYIGLLKGRSTSASLGMYVTKLGKKKILVRRILPLMSYAYFDSVP
jgi:hypothetical protein